MGWLDRLTGRSRKRPSSADPVAVALEEAAAAGPLRVLIEGEQPALMELPQWIAVDEDDDYEGFNTLVELDDEIHFYCDPADGLDLALAEQPGIRDAVAEDREVIYVATRLHPDDVAAAVVRAVVEINRNPRGPDEGRERKLQPRFTPPTDIPAWMVMSRQIVDAVAPQIGEAGYSGREGCFRRAGTDGFVQMLVVRWSPDEHPDETFGHDRISVGYGVWIPGARGEPRPVDPDRVTLLEATLSSSVRVLPDPSAVTEVLATTALPWLEAIDGRDALADWAAENPEQIDPAQRPLIARLLTEWGYPDAVRRVHPAAPWR